MNNSVLVVGSVAYDSIKTPSVTRDNALGGSATYFSISASYFKNVSLVAVVGDDFLEKDFALINGKDVDTSDLQRVNGKTFRWQGSYDFGDLNQRETISTDLNVFADFKPILSKTKQNAPYFILENIDPELPDNYYDPIINMDIDDDEINMYDGKEGWTVNREEITQIKWQ